ncbi:hypothetical protein AREALGSMS7_01121 [Arenibacter algicola]|uniref:Uncharacterized protein n=1 Tax=Arenibacter algicola TaxID=616991 RepID=A0A221UU24_9FLAO|nr:hypothetical protein AREALGSMS7_01121 [Arenibacter algicola]
MNSDANVQFTKIMKIKYPKAISFLNTVQQEFYQRGFVNL